MPFSRTFSDTKEARVSAGFSSDPRLSLPYRLILVRCDIVIKVIVAHDPQYLI
jgi:hypothetical protein